jgi:hypothetical protein
MGQNMSGASLGGSPGFVPLASIVSIFRILRSAYSRRRIGSHRRVVPGLCLFCRL